MAQNIKVHFTIRSLLILSEVLVASDRPREAIGALKAAIVDNNHLRAALLLEQAAYLYILSPKPLFRKFAFHMALAGRHYSTCGNHNLSAQAYTLVLAVHCEHKWPFIDQHMHLSLGKESKSIRIIQKPLGYQFVFTQRMFLRNIKSFKANSNVSVKIRK